MTETMTSPNGAVLSGPATAPYVAPHMLGAAAPPPIASPIPVPDPTVHPMPSGNTVTIASPRILTRGQRHSLLTIENGIPTINTVIRWLVTGWSYPFPIPSADASSLELIPGEDDDALTQAVWPPVRDLLFPKAASPDDHADESSPTAPSGE